MSGVYVVATKVGFFKGLRSAGDTFFVPSKEFDKDSSWYQKAETDQAQASAQANRQPEQESQADSSPQDEDDKPKQNLARMNKAELIALATELGIEVKGDETNPELIAEIQKRQASE